MVIIYLLFWKKSIVNFLFQKIMLMWLLSAVESDIIQPERRGLLSITSKFYDKSAVGLRLN